MKYKKCFWNDLIVFKRSFNSDFSFSPFHVKQIIPQIGLVLSSGHMFIANLSLPTYSSLFQECKKHKEVGFWNVIQYGTPKML